MIKSLLQSKQAFATPVILYLFSRVGPEVLEYEYETVEECLKRIEPKTLDQVVERVNAGLGLFTSDLFWVDPITFSVVCRTLNRHPFPASQEPSLGDITWGVTEASLLFDGATEDAGSSFSDNIQLFVRYLFKQNGVFSLPEALKGMGEIYMNLNFDDAQLAMARQEESDRAAARLDIYAAKHTAEMFEQIKGLKLPLIESAKTELNNILTQYKELKIA